MISIESNGWRVTRRIGVGDRELVRSGLMQVCCVNGELTELQVSAALQAAKACTKTARIYVNVARLTEAEVNRLIFWTMGQSRDHDFMEERNLSRVRFDWVLGRADILIEKIGDGTKEELVELIKMVWKTSGAREFLEGKGRRKSDAETRIEFPEHYGNEDELYEQWVKA